MALLNEQLSFVGIFFFGRFILFTVAHVHYIHALKHDLLRVWIGYIREYLDVQTSTFGDRPVRRSRKMFSQV